MQDIIFEGDKQQESTPPIKFNLLKTQRAILRSAYDANQKIVLWALLDHWSRKSPVPFPSVETLAADASLSERAVQYAVDALEKDAVLGVSRRHNKTNRYYLANIRLACLRHPNPKRVEWAAKELHKLGATDSTPAGNDSRVFDAPAELPGVQEVHLGGAGGAPQNIPGVQEVRPKEPSLSLRDQKKEPTLGDEKIARESVSISTAKKESTGYQAVKQAYVDGYRSVNGEEPAFNDVDHKALQQLLKNQGTEKAERAIRSAFADAWWKTRVTIQQIRSNPARFLALKAEDNAAEYHEWWDLGVSKTSKVRIKKLPGESNEDAKARYRATPRPPIQA